MSRDKKGHKWTNNSVSNTSPKDDKSWDELEDDGKHNNAFIFRMASSRT